MSVLDWLYEARHRLFSVAWMKQASIPHGVKVGQPGWEELYLTQEQISQLREIEAQLDAHYERQHGPMEAGPPY